MGETSVRRLGVGMAGVRVVVVLLMLDIFGVGYMRRASVYCIRNVAELGVLRLDVGMVGVGIVTVLGILGVGVVPDEVMLGVGFMSGKSINRIRNVSTVDV